MNLLIKSMLAILLIGLVGCTQRIVDYTIISTKNIDLSRGAEFKRASSRVTGDDTVHIIIFIPTGIPNMKEAIDRAIESVPGAVALLDGVVSVRSFYIPFIYGQEAYIVEGKALIDPKQVASNSTLKNFSEYNVLHLDANGTIEKFKTVSKSEYKAIKMASIKIDENKKL